MATPSDPRQERFTVTPAGYVKLAWAALAMTTLIIFTGAAVRLSDSGLGCPDWPRCYGKAYPPLDTHSVIEFSNRLISFPVTIAVLAALIGAYRLRPRRRELIFWAWLLPLGVAAQAIVGGLTVKGELTWGWVMTHFALSMLMAVAAIGLLWQAKHAPGWRPPNSDAIVVWGVRAMAAAGALAVSTGMFATAAGPHAGGEPGQSISRWEPKGGETLSWIVHRHGNFAELLGIMTIIVFVICWRRQADRNLTRWVAAVGVLAALQGAVGLLQYHNQLPAELVWLHVVLATFTWLAVLWCVAWSGHYAAPTDKRRQRTA
jgi:cytochrome c oxidase assembly protein subunit 15